MLLQQQRQNWSWSASLGTLLAQVEMRSSQSSQCLSDHTWNIVSSLVRTIKKTTNRRKGCKGRPQNWSNIRKNFFTSLHLKKSPGGISESCLLRFSKCNWIGCWMVQWEPSVLWKVGLHELLSHFQPGHFNNSVISWPFHNQIWTFLSMWFLVG